MGNFSQLNLNSMKNYSSSLSPYGGHSASTTAIADLLNPLTSSSSYTKKENEVRDLEHSDSTTNTMLMMRTNQELYNTVQHANQNSLIINELEKLLNKREFEIQELRLKYNEDLIKIERETMKFKLLFNNKEEELIGERHKVSILQKENDKIQSKLNEINQYMAELPTSDEIKEKTNEINEQKVENESLKQKIGELEKKCNKAKFFIKEKVIFYSKFI
jgi:hypothetical protein